MGVTDRVECEGQCPTCGRWINLTWQASGDADSCPCGMEAVLVVVTEKVLRWYWRDPLLLPEGSGARPAPERPGRTRAMPQIVNLQLRLL